MMNILMRLGPHRFEAKGPSYQSFERSMAARWESIDLIGAAPAYQYMGPGEESASLAGVIFPFGPPSVSGGFRALAAMELEIGRGQPLVLVSGYGKVFGAFGLRNITRTETMAFTRGEPQKIEFSLDLVRIKRRSNRRRTLF